MIAEQLSVRLDDRDITLNVRRRGSGGKTPLVLLHGWPASSACWGPVIDGMGEDRTYIFPDLRGLGDSERKGDVKAFEKYELSLDIKSLLTELGVDSYHVVGQDWGGVVAQELALGDPRVQSLTILNINLINNLAGSLRGYEAQTKNPANPRWYMAFQQTPGFAEVMLPGNEELWIRYFFRFVAEGNSIPEALLQEYIRVYKIKDTPGCGAQYYRAMAKDRERWASLHGTKQTVPSLILYGDKDSFLIPEFYEGYENCFEDVRKKDLHAGHFVQDEIPNDVAECIDDFLMEVEANKLNN